MGRNSQLLQSHPVGQCLSMEIIQAVCELESTTGAAEFTVKKEFPQIYGHIVYTQYLNCTLYKHRKEDKIQRTMHPH